MINYENGKRLALATFLLTVGQLTLAATGEMGMGTPQFGVYSDATGAHTTVWALTNVARSFPAGCVDYFEFAD